MRFHVRRAAAFTFWVATLVAGVLLLQRSGNRAASTLPSGRSPTLSPADVADDPIRHRLDNLNRAGPFRDPLPMPDAGSETRGRGWELYAPYRTTGSGVWPVENETDDRILNQINLGADRKSVDEGDVDDVVDDGRPSRRPGQQLKKILVYDGLDGGTKPGRSKFVEHGCPVDTCSLTEKIDDARTADVILFKDSVRFPPFKRPPSQIWVLFNLESPFHSSSYSQLDNVVNWTATYRLDSTLVTPYEKFAYFRNFTGTLPEHPPRNFAAGKKKLVAWFVSNCAAPNGRSDYVKELQKHIPVDIYGSCGQLTCPRIGHQCFDMLAADYKFYLSFENSNCRDYITEKFYWNALNSSVLPVVMGASPSDYLRVAPPHSFIHVDDFASPADLAAYLRRLDADDRLYNEYFRWIGTGTFIDTKFWCRLCAMVHEAHRTGHRTSVERLHRWWRGRDVCVEPGAHRWASWRRDAGPPPAPNNAGGRRKAAAVDGHYVGRHGKRRTLVGERTDVT